MYSSKQCDTIIDTLCYRTYKIFRRVKIGKKLELIFYIASKYIWVVSLAQDFWRSSLLLLGKIYIFQVNTNLTKISIIIIIVINFCTTFWPTTTNWSDLDEWTLVRVYVWPPPKFLGDQRDSKEEYSVTSGPTEISYFLAAMKCPISWLPYLSTKFHQYCLSYIEFVRLAIL